MASVQPAPQLAVPSQLPSRSVSVVGPSTTSSARAASSAPVSAIYHHSYAVRSYGATPLTTSSPTVATIQPAVGVSPAVLQAHAQHSMAQQAARTVTMPASSLPKKVTLPSTAASPIMTKRSRDTLSSPSRVLKKRKVESSISAELLATREQLRKNGGRMKRVFRGVVPKYDGYHAQIKVQLLY